MSASAEHNRAVCKVLLYTKHRHETLHFHSSDWQSPHALASGKRRVQFHFAVPSILYISSYTNWPGSRSKIIKFQRNFLFQVSPCWNLLWAKWRWDTFLQWRTEREGGFKPPSPPSPKFRRHSNIVPNSTRFWKLLKIAEFRTPTPQVVRKKMQ